MSNSTADFDWVPNGFTIFLHTVPVQIPAQTDVPVSSDADAEATLTGTETAVPTATATDDADDGTADATDEPTAVASGADDDDDEDDSVATATGTADDDSQPTATADADSGSKKRKLHLHLRSMRQQRDEDIEDDNDPDADKTTDDPTATVAGTAGSFTALPVTLDKLTDDAEAYVKSVYNQPLYQVQKPVAEDPGNAEQDYARLIGYKGLRELINSPDKRNIRDGVLTLTEKNLPIDASKVKARVCKSNAGSTLVLEQDEEANVPPPCPTDYTEQKVYGDFILTATQSTPGVVTPSRPPQAASGAGIMAPNGFLMMAMTFVVTLKAIRSVF